MWHTKDVLLDIGSLKKSQLQACRGFYQRPDTAGAPLLARRLLWKLGLFDYKRDESSLMMHSGIPTIFFYLTTGLLNKSIHPLVLLLKTHNFIKSITLTVCSQK
jgi:hypothetical protein